MTMPGYVAPYALVGYSCVMMVGFNCGLRPVRDTSLPALTTVITSIAHIFVVLEKRNAPCTTGNYAMNVLFMVR